jgi:HK97 family phage major capsid protein
MKKSKLAYDAWKASVSAAKAAAAALEGKEATEAEHKALNDLIDAAAAKKDEYKRLLALEEMEEETESDEPPSGRKTFDRAPAVKRGGRGNTNPPLYVSNLFKATYMAQGSGHRATQQEFAKEEFEFSDRLLKSGYQTESMGGVFFPLGDEWLLEPVDARGQKTADFSDLRKELKERLALTVDPGELGRLVKRNPELAAAFGLDRKDMEIGDDTIGGFLIPATQSGRIIDLLRARAACVRAGAMEVPLPPSGNLAYPRLTSDPDFTYTDPDTTSDLSTSNPGTGVVRLLAKSLRGAVTIPNDLIRYSSPAVEMVVRMALASKSALAEDSAFLQGVGSSIAPKGLITYTASTAETPTQARLTLHVAQTTGTDGNTFEPEDVALVQALYEEGNDPDPATAWIMRPMFWATIRNKRGDAVTAGDRKGPFLFDVTRSVADGSPNRLGDVPVIATTQLSKNRSKGASSTLHCVVYGNFRRMIIGRVGVVELAVSEHVKFLQDKTVIRAISRNDVGLEHEESFVFTDTLVQS